MKSLRNFALFLMLASVTACGNGGNSSTETSDSVAVAVIPPPAYDLQHLQFQSQLKGQWCWAACGQMCMGYYGASITQCEQVAQYLGRPNSCPTACQPNCSLPDHSGEPEFGKYQFSSVTADTALNWGQLKYQIGVLQRPIVHGFHYGQSEGTGHFIVIYGYFETPDGNKNLKIFDPHEATPGDAAISYAQYLGDEDSPYWEDFFNISKN